MGFRVLAVCRTHPADSDAGLTLSLAKLEELVNRGQQAATGQREADVGRRAASAQKRELRRSILAGPVAHLASVGRLAGKEDAELAKAFQVKPGIGTYAKFLTTARSMQTAAETHKEVLAKYGLSDAVLERFGTMLAQFDAALLLGRSGRSTHKGATVELRRVATLITQTVRVMDARMQQRFEDNPQALGSWLSARQVLGTPKPGGAGSGGTDIPETPGRPAAPGSGTLDGGAVRPAA